MSDQIERTRYAMSTLPWFYSELGSKITVQVERDDNNYLIRARAYRKGIQGEGIVDPFDPSGDNGDGTFTTNGCHRALIRAKKNLRKLERAPKSP